MDVYQHADFTDIFPSNEGLYCALGMRPSFVRSPSGECQFRKLLNFNYKAYQYTIQAWTPMREKLSRAFSEQSKLLDESRMRHCCQPNA